MRVSNCYGASRTKKLAQKFSESDATAKAAVTNKTASAHQSKVSGKFAPGEEKLVSPLFPVA